MSVPNYLTLRTVSSHKMQDEPGAKSGNWMARFNLPRFRFSVNQFEATMQRAFLPRAGSNTARRRLQNRSDELREDVLSSK